jgi:hypothetical protein
MGGGSLGLALISPIAIDREAFDGLDGDGEKGD